MWNGWPALPNRPTVDAEYEWEEDRNGRGSASVSLRALSRRGRSGMASRRFPTSLCFDCPIVMQSSSRVRRPPACGAAAVSNGILNSGRDTMSDRSRSGSRAPFPTTHWSLVARAGGVSSPDARQAMETLCRAYWFPIYTFIRRHGTDAEAARDLTQTYFARLLEKDLLLAANRQKGRFRSFLKTDCTYFLADQRDRERAQKRGGLRAMIPIEALDAEDRYRRGMADELTPERQFDRTWALTLLDRVLDQLAAEYARSGRGAIFGRLQDVLTPGSAVGPYAALAATLGMTEGAVQVAVHRLRRRYRVILRQQIAATLHDPTDADVEEEIRALFAALG
jgi:RNA polymerase sigma-70 factor (ECF subfamily)